MTNLKIDELVRVLRNPPIGVYQVRKKVGDGCGGFCAIGLAHTMGVGQIASDVSFDLNRRCIPCGLIFLNDDENLSFDEIADVLELVYVHGALDD